MLNKNNIMFGPASLIGRQTISGYFAKLQAALFRVVRRCFQWYNSLGRNTIVHLELHTNTRKSSFFCVQSQPNTIIITGTPHALTATYVIP